MICLTHPLHGTKHAYAEAEALADEKNGWTRSPEKVAEVVKVKNESPDAPFAAPDEVPSTLPTKRGPGRPKKE